jgi:hypothetical protein
VEVAEPTLADVLVSEQDSIISGARARLSHDEDLASVAASRGAPTDQMLTRVLGYWLQAIQSDIGLGSTIAIQNNLEWLDRRRRGPFDDLNDEMVPRMFHVISDVIEERLTDDAQRGEYEDYRMKVSILIERTFPSRGGGT